MGKPRIQGLVRLADRVRHSLAGGLPAGERAAWQKTVSAALEQVRSICREQGATTDALPAPSRRAYAYLAGLDWSSVVEGSGSSTPMPGATVRFSGLQKTLEKLRVTLATGQEREAEAAYDRIRQLSEHIEGTVEREGMQAEELTEPTRQARGWLAMLSQRAYFDQYRHAVAMAEPIFRRSIEAHRTYRPPVEVWFQPMRPPAKIHFTGRLTRVQCRTPLMACGPDVFSALAQNMIHRRSDNRAVHDALLSEPYQALDAELESLGGVVDRTAGVHHDLAASFERVVARYFDGYIARPPLAWSQRLTHRKFGHYDFVHDTILVSATLDRADVPAYVVDYIMHHELLHKQHGIRWRNGRAHAHTVAFDEEARGFERLHEAEQTIHRLSLEVRG